jgi:hypothetical protein
MLGRFAAHVRAQFVGYIALAVAVAGTASLAVAAIPGTNGTVYGCYAKSDGKLRVVDSSVKNGRITPKSCKSSERALAWQRAPMYAFVREDGTLDASRSSGVRGVRPGEFGDGDPERQYVCFDLDRTPMNGVATFHEGERHYVDRDYNLSITVPAYSGRCPAGFRDAAVYVREEIEEGSSVIEDGEPFYVMFN